VLCPKVPAAEAGEQRYHRQLWCGSAHDHPPFVCVWGRRLLRMYTKKAPAHRRQGLIVLTNGQS
jgi:hypothetical protein